MNSGEGGAILSNDEHLLDRCRSFHDNGRGRRDPTSSLSGTDPTTGLPSSKRRYSTSNLRGSKAKRRFVSRTLPIHTPSARDTRHHPGSHIRRLYQKRLSPVYVSVRPEGLCRPAERPISESAGSRGDSLLRGYKPLNKGPFIEATLQSRHYRNIYPEKELSAYKERNHCPENDKLCDEAILVHADHASRAAERYGPDCRSGPEDSAGCCAVSEAGWRGRNKRISLSEVSYGADPPAVPPWKRGVVGWAEVTRKMSSLKNVCADD